jgi:hypothetical protein
MNLSEGELVDLIEDFSEGRVQFAFVKVKDPNTTLPKYVLIGWVSPKVAGLCAGADRIAVRRRSAGENEGVFYQPSRCGF